MGTVVVLAAQVGGAKLADGLYRLRGMDLAVVVNTGDDYRHLGLAFSPDLDTTLFTLAGIASATAGWEPEGETRALQGMLKRLGQSAPRHPPDPGAERHARAAPQAWRAGGRRDPGRRRQGAAGLGRQDDARAGARADRARRGDRIPLACRRLRHRPRGPRLR